MRLGDLLRQYLQLGLSAANGDTRLQAADDGHGVSPAVGFVAQGKGKIQIEMAAGREDGGHIEGGRQDAGDGNRLVVEGERAAHHAGIGTEPPFP